MKMKTTLKEVPHPTIPGREIAVHRYSVNNFRYHSVMSMVSRLLLAMVESQTNNMTGEIVPRDVSAWRSQWAAVKSAWDFGVKHNNPPSAAHEFGYNIALPTGVELQKIPNIKTKMVALEVNHLAEIMMASDSASSGGNIAPQSQADVETQMAIVEDAMVLWIGGGKDNTDVGQQVPIFKHLGELVPDVDFDFASVNEPSADAPDSGRPDVQDTPIIGD